MRTEKEKMLTGEPYDFSSPELQAIRLGAGVLVNCNCVILDGCEVSTGDKTRIRPAVQILDGRSSARSDSAASTQSYFVFRCTRGDGRDARE